MRPSTHSARQRARGLWFVLFALLSAGLTGTASAVDSLPAPFAQDGSSEPAKVSLRDIARQVGYWPAHCAEVENARSHAEASRCWWYAAEEIARLAAGGRALDDEVEKLRVHWLWRGVRLSLRSPAASRPAPPVIEPAARPVMDPAAAAAGSAPGPTVLKRKKTARKKPEVFEPAGVRRQEAALPVVPRARRGTNLTPRQLSRKSRNTAEIADWYR